MTHCSSPHMCALAGAGPGGSQQEAGYIPDVSGKWQEENHLSHPQCLAVVCVSRKLELRVQARLELEALRYGLPVS